MEEACKNLQISATFLMKNIDTTPIVRIDTILDPAKITLNTLSEIESLRPFGIGFSAPIFLLENICAPIRLLGQTGEHIRWDVPGKLEII